MPEPLLHIVTGCSTYLNEGRYTWRHNYILQFIASTFQAFKRASSVVDLAGFVSPSVIIGDSLRPDPLLKVHNRCLYILELTIGYETNLTCNIARKDRKYQYLNRSLQHYYNNVNFINLFISTLGVLSAHSTDSITMLRELSIEDRHLTYTQRKISTITIRSIYCIFCRRGQEWINPELLAI